MSCNKQLPNLERFNQLLLTLNGIFQYFNLTVQEIPIMQAFELRNSLHFFQSAQENNNQTVMASLVGLKGSSYRKPGVRMLIREDGASCGALSGGCVENEIIESAASVFKTGVSKIISYDGRYRLGCEGLLYILIEPFEITTAQVTRLLTELYDRNPIDIISQYEEGDTIIGNFNSVISLPSDGTEIKVNTLQLQINKRVIRFKQTVQPSHQLVIIGAAHDAQKLCAAASFLGWDVVVISSLGNPKTKADFPNSKKVISSSPQTISFDFLDTYTSVVLMTHNYAQDVHYLLKLLPYNPSYIGVLGSKKRKAHLENDLFEHSLEISEEFFDRIHSPAGLDIGAITPQEIAVSIIAEILQHTRIFRNKEATTINQKAFI